MTHPYLRKHKRPVFYGPMARLLDMLNGRRDGELETPVLPDLRYMHVGSTVRFAPGVEFGAQETAEVDPPYGRQQLGTGMSAGGQAGPREDTGSAGPDDTNPAQPHDVVHEATDLDGEGARDAEPESGARDDIEPESSAQDDAERESNARDDTEPESNARDDTEPESNARDDAEPESDARDDAEPEGTASITRIEGPADLHIIVDEAPTAVNGFGCGSAGDFELRTFWVCYLRSRADEQAASEWIDCQIHCDKLREDLAEIQGEIEEAVAREAFLESQLNLIRKRIESLNDDIALGVFPPRRIGEDGLPDELIVRRRQRELANELKKAQGPFHEVRRSLNKSRGKIRRLAEKIRICQEAYQLRVLRIYAHARTRENVYWLYLTRSHPYGAALNYYRPAQPEVPSWVLEPQRAVEKRVI
ncbi:hypothetical protein GCM10009555_003240 [Acrocarpospora macrocephala]|uniref:Uncharacterized protein n=1 Tax=Acrocarpospora macrocephala TaxID=150177 RepID=A0A5M3X0L6_9ACTN|nr:hypothetical protein [Acrocarpospora macrocephala]GES15305.1 hypothetical protein Amac_089020 [Acrocarpospora macrocephala]